FREDQMKPAQPAFSEEGRGIPLMPPGSETGRACRTCAVSLFLASVGRQPHDACAHSWALRPTLARTTNHFIVSPPCEGSTKTSHGRSRSAGFPVARPRGQG